MLRNDQGHNGPESRGQKAVADPHGDDAEVRVGEGEGDEAVAEEGDDDGNEHEGDVPAELVDQVPERRGQEGCYQVDNTWNKGIAYSHSTSFF